MVEAGRGASCEDFHQASIQINPFPDNIHGVLLV